MSGKIKYIVENIHTGEVFETMAVSERDAINHIHYLLWFEEKIWTEMYDFTAEPEVRIRFRRLREENDKRRDQTECINAESPSGIRDKDSEQYVQLSFSWA